MHEEEPLPSIQQPFPLAFKIGWGAGVGVGCGLGVGFGAPFDLRGLPGVGPAAASVSNSLAPLLASAAGATSGLRGAVQRLGVRGLDLGVGCGVGLGYGFGAGLMLRPSALDALQQQGQRLLAAVTSRLPAAVGGQGGASPHAAADVGAPLTAAAGGTAAAAMTAPQLGPASGNPFTSSLNQLNLGSSGSSSGGQLAITNPPSAASALAAGLAAAAHTGSQPPWTTTSTAGPTAAGTQASSDQRGPHSSALPSSSTPSSSSSHGEVWQALYQQQVVIGRLQQQNRALRAALCRARPRDAVCRTAQHTDGAAGCGLWSE